MWKYGIVVITDLSHIKEGATELNVNKIYVPAKGKHFLWLSHVTGVFAYHKFKLHNVFVVAGFWKRQNEDVSVLHPLGVGVVLLLPDNTGRDLHFHK